MSRVLENLEPKAVFHFFEDLTRIPHGSRNTKAISDYCVSFAKERGLWVYQDALNNVIIKKPASAGYEASPAVILQGHLDMVAEKTPESPIDFTKDALELRIEGDYVSANGTTLGGDDGIAVAMALAVLDSDVIAHPAGRKCAPLYSLPPGKTKQLWLPPARNGWTVLPQVPAKVLPLLSFRNIWEFHLTKPVLSEITSTILKCFRMPGSATQFPTPAPKSGLPPKIPARPTGKTEFCKF